MKSSAGRIADNNKTWSSTLRSPIVWITVLFVLLINGFFLRYLLENQRELTRELSARLEQKLNEEFFRLDTVLKSYEGFFKASQDVTPGEYQTFGQVLLKNSPSIYQVAYAPRVMDSERAAFEQWLRQEGARRQQLYFLDYYQQEFPLEKESFYFPVKYQSDPRVAGDLRGVSILGIDGPIFKDELDSGMTVSSIPYNMDWAGDNMVFNIYRPLFVDQSGPGGIIAVVVILDRILSTVTLPAGYSISLKMLDEQGDVLSDVWHRGDLMASPDFILKGQAVSKVDAFNRVFQFQVVREFSLGLVQWLTLFALIVLSFFGVSLVLLLDRSRLSVIEARSASRTKSQFLAVMSHEIRTPLNGVMGLAELLSDSDLPLQEKKYAQMIVHSGQSLLQIINDILDFSKIEAGHLEIEERPVDLALLIDELQELYALAMEESSVLLSASISPDCPNFIITDSTRLRQILQNLLSNAFKFTSEGEIVLRVITQGDRLRFSVRDTGIGIAPEQQRQLFLPFSQADSSVTRRFGGTGLGLSICKQLVEIMGGEIGVISSPEKGSEFWFTIPSKTTGEQLLETGGDYKTLAGKRVLVVDDYETARLILTEQCRSLGMTVTTAADVDSAWRKMNNAGQKFDFILTDFDMPDVDGAQFAQQLANDPATAGIPVFLVSASTSLRNRYALDLPGVFVSSKPTSYQQLATLLMRYEEPAEPDRAVVDRSLRILVVEDNSVNAMVVRGMLNKLNHHHELCENGQVALDVIEYSHGEFDLILMDCEMPVMDGFTTSQRIRQFEQQRQLPPLPIVALTAHGPESQRARCLEAGMNTLISKPIELEVLKNTLDLFARRSLPQ